MREHAFGESFLTIPDGLLGERWRLLHSDLSTPLKKEPALPLTLPEKRWMKSLLLDPRIRLFDPDVSGLEDVDPLFTPDVFVYYDRYLDGDDYSDPAYIDHFRTILHALREKHNLYLCYQTRSRQMQKIIVTPAYLEYSEKDDRFRLVGAGKKRNWILNLSGIKACEIAENNEIVSLHPAEKKSVTFELIDRRNALARVLLHFSHLEKETKRLDQNRYLVTLQYAPQDETEMLIRILSFGPVIRVIAPDHFIALIRKRLAAQNSLCL